MNPCLKEVLKFFLYVNREAFMKMIFIRLLHERKTAIRTIHNSLQCFSPQSKMASHEWGCPAKEKAVSVSPCFMPNGSQAAETMDTALQRPIRFLVQGPLE